MFSPIDLPDTISVFPLPGALLLPRTKLPLHVFEPRYLAMLDDCLKTPHRLIGMIQPKANGSDEQALHGVGCAGRITSFSETDDGRYMITLKGVSRFQILSEVEGFTPYRKFDVRWAGFERDFGAPELDPLFDRSMFIGLLERFFKEQELESEWASMPETEDEVLVNSLAMLCPFSPEDRQALLEARSLQERRKILTTLMEFTLLGGRGDGARQ